MILCCQRNRENGLANSNANDKAASLRWRERRGANSLSNMIAAVVEIAMGEGERITTSKVAERETKRRQRQRHATTAAGRLSF